MNRRVAVTSFLSRHLGPAFAAMATAGTSLSDAPDKPGCPEGFTPAPLPDGWGTSPRRAPTPAKAYKPAHGGYPGTQELDNAKQER